MAKASEPQKPRDAVIRAGRKRLLRQPLEALRSQLNASMLAGVSPVSRDTAYRIFRDDPEHPNVTDAIIAAVSAAAHDPAWTGYHGALLEALAATQGLVRGDSDVAGNGSGSGSGDSPREGVVAGLRAIYEAQFRSPGLPVGWLLQAAALTSSPAWQGERPAEDDEALGREILAQRRDFYRETNEQMVRFLTIVLSELGRRPRPGLGPDALVKLLHALLDGAVLRNMIEPGAFSSSMVAEAMYGLAEALTEAGPLTDPRRPADERGGETFDRLVDAADELWSTQSEVTVEAVAERAGVLQEAADLLFPTIGDLADSLMRVRVVGGGFTDTGPLPADARVNERLVVLLTELRSLRDFADECPHAVAVTRDRPPEMSSPFVEDFLEHESRVVAALGLTPNPVRLVRDLVGFASQGREGWPAVLALLRTIGYTDT